MVRAQEFFLIRQRLGTGSRCYYFCDFAPVVFCRISGAVRFFFQYFMCINLCMMFIIYIYLIFDYRSEYTILLFAFLENMVQETFRTTSQAEWLELQGKFEKSQVMYPAIFTQFRDIMDLTKTYKQQVIMQLNDFLLQIYLICSEISILKKFIFNFFFHYLSADCVFFYV